jgi:hypothetical protein
MRLSWGFCLIGSSGGETNGWVSTRSIAFIILAGNDYKL